MMRLTVLFVAAALALPAAAQRSVTIPGSERDRLAVEQAQLERLRAQQDHELRAQRARENCLRNRGVDCDTPQGLEEWLQLERSRGEAVLDRIAVPAPAPGSASTGSSLAR
jgi:hypothetical protein